MQGRIFEDMQESRTEAINAAIEKANVIYNESKL